MRWHTLSVGIVLSGRRIDESYLGGIGVGGLRYTTASRQAAGNHLGRMLSRRINWSLPIQFGDFAANRYFHSQIYREHSPRLDIIHKVSCAWISRDFQSFASNYLILQRVCRVLSSDAWMQLVCSVPRRNFPASACKHSHTFGRPVRQRQFIAPHGRR